MKVKRIIVNIVSRNTQIRIISINTSSPYMKVKYCEYHVKAKIILILFQSVPALNITVHNKILSSSRSGPRSRSRPKMTFTHKGNLNTHIKSIHEGKTYQCQLCEQKFTQKGSLNTHIKSIHEGKTYHCQHCEQRFTQKGNLSTHIKYIHEGKT